MHRRRGKLHLQQRQPEKRGTNQRREGYLTHPHQLAVHIHGVLLLYVELQYYSSVSTNARPRASRDGARAQRSSPHYPCYTTQYARRKEIRQCFPCTYSLISLSYQQNSFTFLTDFFAENFREVEKPRSLLVMHPKDERRRSKVHYPIAAAKEEGGKGGRRRVAALSLCTAVGGKEGKKLFFAFPFPHTAVCTCTWCRVDCCIYP